MRISARSLPWLVLLLALDCGGSPTQPPLPPNTQRVCGRSSCTVVCLTNFEDCDGDAANGCEVSVLTNPNHCGGCNKNCSNNNIPVPACSSGQCTGECAAGFADCNGNKRVDGCENDLLIDRNNCGMCDLRCAAPTKNCVSGTCVP